MHVLVFVAQTEEEYLEMMESDEVKEMKKLHVEYRESLEIDLLNTMNDITQSRNVRLQIVLLHLFIGIQLNGIIIIIIIIIIIAKLNHLSFFGKQVHKQKQVVSEEFTSSTKQRFQENSSICCCKAENREKVWYNQCHHRAFCSSSHEVMV